MNAGQLPLICYKKSLKLPLICYKEPILNGKHAAFWRTKTSPNRYSYSPKSFFNRDWLVHGIAQTGLVKMRRTTAPAGECGGVEVGAEFSEVCFHELGFCSSEMAVTASSYLIS